MTSVSGFSFRGTVARFRSCLFAALVTSSAFSGFGDPVVYTVVTTDSDATNLLSEASVEVNDNGEVTTLPFADVSFAEGSVFRKRGPGFLLSCSGMKEFTGEVRIEEGALIIAHAGELGEAVESSKTDPLVVVSNGASLVIAGLKGEVSRNEIRLCGGLNVAGNGYKGLGAVRSDCTERIKYLFSSNVTLNDDALFVNASVTPGDTSDSINDRAWGTKASQIFDLGGHTLTFSGNQFVSYNVTYKNPGNVVLAENASFQFSQHKVPWTGGEANCFTVCSNALLEMNGACPVESPWTLVLEDGARLQGGSGSASLTNYCRWCGPVRVNGRAFVDNGGADSGLTFQGPVSGNGLISLAYGGLNLANSLNSFSGSVLAVSKAELAPVLNLWSGTALSMGSEYVATNSTLALKVADRYDLPDLSFHAKAGKTLFVSGGACGTARSFCKTGPGAVELSSPLEITGGIDLREGLLRLSAPSPYSYRPGLIESRYEAGSESEYNALLQSWYTDGSVMNTNRVVSFPVLAETTGLGKDAWAKYSFVRYRGYIWNRQGKSVNWTFATAICPQSLLFIDNAEVPLIRRDSSGGAASWKKLAPTTVELAPGPHYFDLRVAVGSYSNPGARAPTDNTTDWPTAGFGFVIDTQGRGSYDSACYAIPSNSVLGTLAGGDGVLFTIDDQARETASGADFSRASCAELRAVPGTVLDLNAAGFSFPVDSLVGATAVSNGNLRVASTWSLSVADLASGIPLSGDASICFDEGWCLVLTDFGSSEFRAKRLTLARAAAGGLTLPAETLFVDGRGREWDVLLSDEGRLLELVRRGTGLILIFK